MAHKGKEALTTLLYAVTGAPRSEEVPDMDAAVEKLWPLFKEAVQQASIEVQGDLMRAHQAVIESQKRISRILEELEERPKN